MSVCVCLFLCVIWISVGCVWCVEYMYGVPCMFLCVWCVFGICVCGVCVSIWHVCALLLTREWDGAKGEMW